MAIIRRRLSGKGFTLAEIIMVVVIISVLMTIAIPSYLGVLERETERQIATNLQLIFDAMEVRRALEGGYVPNNLIDVGAINQELDLRILPAEGETYSCTGDATSFTCVGDPDPTDARFNWEVHTEVDTNPGVAMVDPPHCSVGTCPVCVDSPQGGCPYLINQ